MRHKCQKLTKSILLHIWDTNLGIQKSNFGVWEDKMRNNTYLCQNSLQCQHIQLYKENSFWFMLDKINIFLIYFSYRKINIFLTYFSYHKINIFLTYFSYRKINIFLIYLAYRKINFFLICFSYRKIKIFIIHFSYRKINIFLIHKWWWIVLAVGSSHGSARYLKSL